MAAGAAGWPSRLVSFGGLDSSRDGHKGKKQEVIGARPRARLITAGFALCCVALVVFVHAPGSDAFANIVLCGQPGMSPGTSIDPCDRTLVVAQNPPLGGTDAYYATHCSNDGFTCLPVQHPIGDWFAVTLANAGSSRAGAFTVGLYSSGLVDDTTKECALDFEEPRKFAEPIARVQVPSLGVGEIVDLEFDPETVIHHWQASEHISERDRMHRCFFVFADDNDQIFEIQANERDNVALAPVKLLDLVDLQITGRRLRVDFNQAPWMTGEITNVGLVEAPSFRVDWFQIDTNDFTEDCPVMTNEEYPLTVPRFTDFWLVYLGSTTVTDLQPNAPRLVLPTESRVPGSRTNVTNTCIVMLVDALSNIPEPHDGISNVMSRTIAIDDIKRFIKAPTLVVLTPPWNKIILLYIACGVLVFLGLCYCYYRQRQAKKAVASNETTYLARKKAERPPTPEKKEAPIPRFEPDDEFLLQEEAAAGSNPDFHRPVRVGKTARKTGIVRDKRGNVIGTISANGVIRDKNGKRIGVSAIAPTPHAPPQQPSKRVLDGFFGSADGVV